MSRCRLCAQKHPANRNFEHTSVKPCVLCPLRFSDWLEERLSSPHTYYLHIVSCLEDTVRKHCTDWMQIRSRLQSARQSASDAVTWFFLFSFFSVQSVSLPEAVAGVTSLLVVIFTINVKHVNPSTKQHIVKESTIGSRSVTTYELLFWKICCDMEALGFWPGTARLH